MLRKCMPEFRFECEDVDGAGLASLKQVMQRNEEKFTDNMRSDYSLTLVQTSKFMEALKRLRNE